MHTADIQACTVINVQYVSMQRTMTSGKRQLSICTLLRYTFCYHIMSNNVYDSDDDDDVSIHVHKANLHIV